VTGRLEGKTALVTAAAQGIGRAMAENFALEGAQVIATDINMDKLSELNLIHGISTRHLDVLDPVEVKSVTSDIGTVNILASCTGFVHHGSILECEEEDFSFSMDLNVGGAYRMIRAVLPGMLENGNGSIINIASVVSSITGVPNRLVYGASKAGLIGLMKSVAIDFIGTGVRCNAICPGTVQSPSLDERINALPDPVQGRRDFIRRQPMGRLGTTGEIAAMGVYLASDAAAFVSGSEFIIDGGMTL
jgi:2-keto-3-deoxy-L-fuconate dehydrogenase